MFPTRWPGDPETHLSPKHQGPHLKPNLKPRPPPIPKHPTPVSSTGPKKRRRHYRKDRRRRRKVNPPLGMLLFRACQLLSPAQMSRPNRSRSGTEPMDSLYPIRWSPNRSPQTTNRKHLGASSDPNRWYRRPLSPASRQSPCQHPRRSPARPPAPHIGNNLAVAAWAAHGTRSDSSRTNDEVPTMTPRFCRTCNHFSNAR